MKAKLTSSPILAKPDFSRQFEIHIDASAIAVGAVLIQRDEGDHPVVVSYSNSKLKEAEVKYPTIDLEALAVVEAVRAFVCLWTPVLDCDRSSSSALCIFPKNQVTEDE